MSHSVPSNTVVFVYSGFETFGRVTCLGRQDSCTSRPPDDKMYKLLAVKSLVRQLYCIRNICFKLLKV